MPLGSRRPDRQVGAKSCRLTAESFQSGHATCSCACVRVLVYQNPDAGHEPKSPRPLVDELQRAGHQVEWRNAKKDRITGPMAAGFDLIVAAGGDGNVGRTARQLIGLPVPIAVLPLGTANNLATVLGAKPTISGADRPLGDPAF